MQHADERSAPLNGRNDLTAAQVTQLETPSAEAALEPAQAFSTPRDTPHFRGPLEPWSEDEDEESDEEEGVAETVFAVAEGTEATKEEASNEAEEASSEAQGAAEAEMEAAGAPPPLAAQPQPQPQQPAAHLALPAPLSLTALEMKWCGQSRASTGDIEARLRELERVFTISHTNDDIPSRLRRVDDMMAALA